MSLINNLLQWVYSMFMKISFFVILLFLVFSLSRGASALAAVACTADAKLCPDGVTYVGRDGSRHCQWQLCPGEKDPCAQYVCNDGTRIDACTLDGTVIQYFAEPCLAHAGQAANAEIQQKPFSDVPLNHANIDGIIYLKAQGIVQGYQDGTFKPDAIINRAEFLRIVTGPQFNSTEVVDSCIDRTVSPSARTVFFRDVNREDWFAKFVCMAKERRIIDGYPDRTFRPAAPITFPEASKILITLFVGNLASDDMWYTPYAEKMGEMHAIPFSITRIDQPITRGELAEMVYRLKTKNTTKTHTSYDFLSSMERCRQWLAVGGINCE